MRELPIPDGDDHWSVYRRALRVHVLEGNLDQMIHWSTIQATMFVGQGLLVTECIRELKKVHKHKGFQRDEDRTNLVHKRYHWHMWEKEHQQSLRGIKKIVEFGAGYGASAVVADRLGFKGQYHIIDFPELVLLQQFWLADKIKNCHVRFGDYPRDPDILVSMDGLSETTMNVREHFMRGMKPKTYLFSACSNWGPINNRDWFIQWAQKYFTAGGPMWTVTPTPIIASHFYLVSHA